MKLLSQLLGSIVIGFAVAAMAYAVMPAGKSVDTIRNTTALDGREPTLKGYPFVATYEIDDAARCRSTVSEDCLKNHIHIASEGLITDWVLFSLLSLGLMAFVRHIVG